MDITEQLTEVKRRYPVLIPPFLRKRMEEGSYSEAAALQYSPDNREIIDSNLLSKDPCNESMYKKSSSFIQKYDNRAALILTQKCLAYCRFCFRKDFVGHDVNAVSEEELNEAISLLENDPTVQDVLVSGGDPLALPNRVLLPILERLAAIDHLKVIRIHTRAASTTPKRLDDSLLNALSKGGKFWFYTHMNHIDDLEHPDVISVIDRIQSRGIPVLNQGVILGEVNDSASAIEALMLGLYHHRIIPYHLYTFDPVNGAGHFSTDVDTVLEIYERLNYLPGPAQPVLVVVDSNNKKRRFVYDDAVGTQPLQDLLIERGMRSSCTNGKMRT